MALPLLNTPEFETIIPSSKQRIKFRPFLVKCVNEEDLDLILSFVLAEYTARNNSTDDASVISDIQKDAVGMLGILCSQPHPVQVNEKICDVFLGGMMRPSATTAVLSEILNALMDMYSADEGDPNNHEGVFRSKGVLGGFQKIVPVLKRKIKEDEKKDGANPEDIEFSKETVLNATRFIRYKKGT